jgi:hypothetical protein
MLLRALAGDALGGLEVEKHAAANVVSLLDRFQSRCELLPPFVAE